LREEMAYSCPICPKPTKIEEDTASGNVICRGCGTVHPKNKYKKTVADE